MRINENVILNKLYESKVTVPFWSSCDFVRLKTRLKRICSELPEIGNDKPRMTKYHIFEAIQGRFGDLLLNYSQ